MLLNLTWLIPGLPISLSVLIAVLLLSFRKTMNRLTKPVSYLIIISLIIAEIINFVLFKQHITGNILLFGNNFKLTVDNSALLFSQSIGLIFLLIMLFSFFKLKRQNGYVRYFTFLGLLSGLVFMFSFSGSPFHNIYDPLLSFLNRTGISL